MIEVIEVIGESNATRGRGEGGGRRQGGGEEARSKNRWEGVNMHDKVG